VRFFILLAVKEDLWWFFYFFQLKFLTRGKFFVGSNIFNNRKDVQKNQNFGIAKGNKL
jgi:hypothetical protein